MGAREQVRLLIVEDDEDDFIIARDLLREQDHFRCEIEWASEPEQALRLIRGGKHDVYLIDHRLGPTTGLELVRHAFGERAHVPVIMLTGYDDHEVDLEAERLGVTDFLIKSHLDGALLERSIRYAVRHHAVLDELREAQERYALAVRGANDGIWDWDLVNDAVYYGPRWKEILGHSDAEIGRSPREWFDRVAAEDREQLRTAIETHTAGSSSHFDSEHRIRHADGGYRWVFTRGVAVRDADGIATRIAGSMSDITDRKTAEERLRYDARHDSLTGLPNRDLFLDHLELSLSRGKRDPHYLCAVLFLDLNRFKRINDVFSHATGDQALIALARRLRAAMREGDTVARIGGDEFTILLHDIESVDAAVEVAKRIQRTVRRSFSTEGRELVVTASIGIAVSEPRSEASEMMRNADIAMYEAKVEGADACAVFTASMRNRVVGQLKLESELRDAIDRERLHVFYQPIFNLEDGTLSGLEALVRWPRDAERDVSPIEFIPIAEETGLIQPLGRLVLREACSRLSEWRADGLVGDGVALSVNVSARQLGESDLLEDVSAALRRSGLPADALRLEITEGTIMRDPERMPAILDALSEIGVGAFIDDFGIGYSSLTFLRHFGGNALKIDRSFIASLCGDDGTTEIVRAIVGLARDLNLEVIAEGVETEAQLRELRALGAGYAQGFLFSEPLDAAQTRSRLASWDGPGISALVGNGPAAEDDPGSAGGPLESGGAGSGLVSGTAVQSRHHPGA
jgi:diguanylate cyclase (GGDEF)-like protein/PAS domain S-box-containing protein